MYKLQVQRLELPSINHREWLRYAAVQGLPDRNLSTLLEECLLEARTLTGGKVCYFTFSKADFLRLIPSASRSASVENYLQDCDRVVLFAATIGIEIDFLIGKYATLSTVKSLLFQALGAERIESLCDAFTEYYQQKEGLKHGQLKVRRSPGYGDFALEAQKEIFSILEPHKHLGLTLTNSLMMTPTKSVSAIMGIRS